MYFQENLESTEKLLEPLPPTLVSINILVFTLWTPE